MRWSLRPERVPGALLPLLAIVAEGAWITVAYVAIEVTIHGRPPLLGVFEFSAVAGAAALAVRRGWLHPDDDPFTFLAAMLAAGAVGWLWHDAPRELLLDGNVVEAISLHPGGWLAILAMMRGVGHGVEIDDRSLTRLVLVGVPALALPWAMGQLASGDLRGDFTVEAFVASLSFVAAGFMAAGLARLGAIGRETGIDWRRHRAWLWTVLAVLGIVLAIAIPAAYLLGVPVDAVTRGLIGPVATLVGYLFLALAYVLAIISAAVYSALSQLGISLPPPLTQEQLERFPAIREYTFEQLRGPLVGIGIVWIALLLLALVLARTWLRRSQRRGLPRAEEERSIALPQVSLRLESPRIRLPQPWPWRRAPTDAVTAYLVSLVELDNATGGSLGRREHETPRAHAARIAPLRPAVATDLVRLQAGYALVRYGGRTLPSREHRRAVSRWRRLRSSLRSLAGPRFEDR